MHHVDTHFDPKLGEEETVASLGPKARLIPLQVGLGGLAVAVVASFLSKGGTEHLAYSYLIALAYVASISLGALFFVSIQHVVRAGWSVVIRRLAEILATGLIPIALLFLPILILVMLGSKTPYVWANPEIVAGDVLIQGKIAYLNSTFFIIRNLIYFGFWAWLSRFYLIESRKQDITGDPNLSFRLEGVAAPCILLFALTLTFASFDWLMSLQPQWFSTIFGVYYFAGAVMSFFATMSLLSIGLLKQGKLQNSVTVEHRSDLGKLMFGFTCFWAYMAFSQYLLIWYSNIPEETHWYDIRQNHGWQYVSLALIFGHFVLPFLGLLSRHVKRNINGLRFWSVWLLVMQWVDLYWLAMPALHPETGPSFGIVDIGCMVGVVGLWLFGIQKLNAEVPLMAVRDPRLPESLAFHNYY